MEALSLHAAEQPTEAATTSPTGRATAAGASDEPDAATVDIAPPTDDATEVSDTLPPKPRKQPSDDAIAVYRLWFGTQRTQEEIARLYTQQKRPVHQGTVSRWIEEVKGWLEAGNVLPAMTAANDCKPMTMDPDRIDLGPNREGRAASQKKRRNSDSDD